MKTDTSYNKQMFKLDVAVKQLNIEKQNESSHTKN